MTCVTDWEASALRHVLRSVHKLHRALRSAFRRCTTGVLCLYCVWDAYRHLADVSEFVGVLNLAAGRNDVVVFSGQFAGSRCNKPVQAKSGSTARARVKERPGK